MDARERVRRALSFQEADRVPITDSVWVSTIGRWRQEGLPADQTPDDYFGYELVKIGPDQSPQFPTRTLEDTGERIVETTPYGGIVLNRKDFASVPAVIEYPCKTRDDWENRIKPRLQASKDRVDWLGEWPRGFAYDERQDVPVMPARRGFPGYQTARKEGKAVAYFAHIGSGHIHQSYLDVEHLLLAIIDDPAWVVDMYETAADLVLDMYDIMVEGGFDFDAAFLACDLGFNHSTFFSPRHFERQLHPTFARVFSFFHERGIPVILHSDGRILDLVPYFVKEGLDCLNPLEVKAGMDLVQLKRMYGDRLAFMGGIDVQAMADPDPRVIEEEIKTKLPAAKEGGGYIYHSDHSVPNNVSFDQYRRVIDLVLKYGSYG